MNRRNFIKFSSAFAVSAAVMPSALSAFSPDKKTALGLQLWSVRDAMKTDAMGTLKSLSKFGYNYVENFGLTDGKWFGIAPVEMKKA